MDNIENDIHPVIKNWDLDEEQEKKEIVRHYRALLKILKSKLKKGDKELLRAAFEMAANAHKTMRQKKWRTLYSSSHCSSNDLCR